MLEQQNCFQKQSLLLLYSKATADLALKYSEDLDFTEFQLEVESFKHQARVLTYSEEPSPLELLQLIHRLALNDVYPNIKIALRLLLTLHVTLASCERSRNAPVPRFWNRAGPGPDPMDPCGSGSGSGSKRNLKLPYIFLV